MKYICIKITHRFIIVDKNDTGIYVEIESA